jgi:Zn-dependent protease
MRWSFPIATIRGTEVRIHVTFLLLLALYGAGSPSLVAALWIVGFICSLFFCVLLHEFGHVTAARAFGIRTPNITLYPIGGAAYMERLPKNPWHEVVIALAGPLVNVVIAGVLWGLIGLGVLPVVPMEEFGAPSVGSYVLMLALGNSVLAVFNMIPAFPMDGGRVLRALLAIRFSYERATQIAAFVGQGLAVGGGFYAILNGQWLLALIATFIYFVAGREAQYVKTQEATKGVPVRAAMITQFVTLPHAASLGDAAEALQRGSQHDFPLTAPDGRVVGMLCRRELVKALAASGAGSSVLSAAVRDFPRVEEDFSLHRGLELLQESPCSTLPVYAGGEDDRLVGILTGENVGEFIMVRRALAKHV